MHSHRSHLRRCGLHHAGSCHQRWQRHCWAGSLLLAGPISVFDSSRVKLLLSLTARPVPPCAGSGCQQAAASTLLSNPVTILHTQLVAQDSRAHARDATLQPRATVVNLPNSCSTPARSAPCAMLPGSHEACDKLPHTTPTGNHLQDCQHC